MAYLTVTNDEEHKVALARIQELWDCVTDTPESDELEALAALVDAYESKRWPFDPPEPIEAERFRLEQEANSDGQL